MHGILADVHSGRKNIVVGIVLFLILGVGAGIPLTIDFFGGSLLSSEQYQAWKVVHGYAVFLAFINYFFGVSIDRWPLTRQQKEIASWCILVTGLFGGVLRPLLLLFGVLDAYGIYASLGETVFITIGTVVFILGQTRTGAPVEQGQPAPRLHPQSR
jgi:hypothetical protein